MKVQCPNCEQWYEDTVRHLCKSFKNARDTRDDTGINASS